MTKQELREKIIEILYDKTKYIDKYNPGHGYITVVSNYNELADALIAAGIGDVSSEKAMRELAEAFHREKCAEYDLINYKLQKEEHRAEVWKQATKDMIDTDICFGCHARATGICFKQGLNPGTDECMNAIYKQAEKELQEERKNVR